MTVDVVVWKQAMRKHPGMLTAREIGVALGLTLWMNRGGNCNAKPPSIQTIANTLGKSDKSVRRGLKELVAKGWLEVEHREGRPSLLQATVPEDLDVDTFEIIATPPTSTRGKATDPSQPGQGSGMNPSHLDQGSDSQPLPTGPGVPLPPGTGVGATPPKNDPNPSHLGQGNSTELYKTTSNSSVLRGREAEDAEGGNDITPESRPDLWARAQHATTEAKGIKNREAYRMAIFKRLIAEEEAQDRAALHDAEVDDCPHCNSAGFLLKTEDGHQVAYRCSHQGVPT